jgi:hypothetical protein
LEIRLLRNEKEIVPPPLAGEDYSKTSSAFNLIAFEIL